MAVNKNMNILVVDDNRNIIGIVKTLLQSLGFTNIDEAIDGKDALEKILTKTYALIIANWNMKSLPGPDLLNESGYNNGQPVFLMVTTGKKKEGVLADLAVGINNHIAQPFNADTLKDRLVSIFGEFEAG